MSAAEALLALHVAGVKLPPPLREYPFAAMEVGRGPGVKQRLRLAGLRNWRFDFAWPPQRLAVLIDGASAWDADRESYEQRDRRKRAYVAAAASEAECDHRPAAVPAALGHHPAGIEHA